eukprot:scaffold3102_cov198-Pinguiococcus_pyrenoidosus.AAC.3
MTTTFIAVECLLLARLALESCAALRKPGPACALPSSESQHTTCKAVRTSMHGVQGRKSSAAGGRRQAAERGWQCSASSTSRVCSCPKVGFDLAKTRMRIRSIIDRDGLSMAIA